MSRVKQLPSTERPRERLLRLGGTALSDAELVAVLFGGGLERAWDLVGDLGGITGMARAGLGELCERPGVGLARACQLIAAIELGRRSLSLPLSRGDVLRTPSEVADCLADMISLEEEELHVLALDNRHRLLARVVAARGGLNTVHILPRDVLRRVVREGAASMIVAHNHPGGDHRPSPEDRELTRRLRAAGDLVGVPLLDHLIIARDGYHSFAADFDAP